MFVTRGLLKCAGSPASRRSYTGLVIPVAWRLLPDFFVASLNSISTSRPLLLGWFRTFLAAAASSPSTTLWGTTTGATFLLLLLAPNGAAAGLLGRLFLNPISIRGVTGSLIAAHTPFAVLSAFGRSLSPRWFLITNRGGTTANCMTLPVASLVLEAG